MTASPRPIAARALVGVGAAMALLTISPWAVAEERYAAYVIDLQTREVLHDDSATEQRFPASLTKMMTLYLLFDALEAGEVTLNTRLPVSKAAALQPPSKLGLKRGGTISVEDAIEALVTKSANDVAVVVAEKLGGSEARFAAKMTAKARDLGMTGTRFVNASGLPDTRQVTTAKDMAALGEALLRDHPERYAYFRTPGMTWGSRYARNHNRLLDTVQGVDGIKTGYTRASGFNLTSSVERGGRRLVAVVMGGESAAARDAQMAHIIEGAYELIAQREAPLTATLASLPVNRVAIEFRQGGFAANVNQVGADRASYTSTAPVPRFDDGDTDQGSAEEGDGRLQQPGARADFVAPSPIEF